MQTKISRDRQTVPHP